MDLNKFKAKPLLGILRGAETSHIEPLIETSIVNGLETLEIAMNTPGAAEQIKKAVETADGKLMIGAGTVTNMQRLHEALNAGATFIVMPVIIKEIIEYCVQNKIPVFPGALTPNEVYQAWQLKASMVKVFPAKFFGPEYFKALKAPLNEVKLLACGGVRPENMESYFKSGADAVAFGANVFKKEWLDKKDFKSIGKCIKAFTIKFDPAK